MKNSVSHEKKAITAVECISQGWHLAGQNLVLFIGIFLVANFVFGCIPVVNVFLYGPVLVGIYFTFLRQLKGEPVNLKMMFTGFINFLPAMVIGIIIGIPGIINSLIQLTINLLKGFEILTPEKMNSIYESHFWAVVIGFVMFSIILFVIGFIISVSMFFAPPLLAEHKLKTAEVIKYSFRAGWDNVGGLFRLFLLEMLVAIGGILLCCIGVFFTVPIIIAANTIAYRQVFPESDLENSFTN